jgi:predicted amidohydrolase
MSDANRVRVAAAQYDIGFFTDWTAYADKLSQWVGQAAAGGAQLLVFPEYGAMELVSLFTPAVRRDLAAQLEALQALRERFLALHTELAVQHRVHILAASFPVRVADGGYRNRAHLFGPGGGVGYQDKLQMTRFENEQWLIRGGDQLRVFDTALGRLGVAICYDAEFPLPVRRQVEAGAELILVPSCTDALAGYHRVRTGCLARALENQCYVIQAPTVGEAGWSEAVDVNVGAAAVYTPADRGFPDDGVLAVGPLNTPQWVFADLSAERIAAVRRDGQVLNHRDWSARNHSAACDVDTVSVD